MDINNKTEFLDKIIDLIEFHGFTSEDSYAPVRLREDLSDLIYQYSRIKNQVECGIDNFENYD
jgi:hypothetical protein